METQESVVLTATIEQEEDRYVVRIDELDLEGTGESLEAAQDELIQIMRAWIETHDGTDSLSKAMDNAGYPGVDEDTELQLEFVEAAMSTEGE
jgi:predicted RNase H-like HicB family nuclease